MMSSSSPEALALLISAHSAVDAFRIGDESIGQSHRNRIGEHDEGLYQSILESAITSWLIAGCVLKGDD